MRPAGSGDDRRTRDQSALHYKDKAAFYREKAAECLRQAEFVIDATGRDHWIEMANGWAQLALRAERLAQL
jgi:hypothetical protein